MKELVKPILNESGYQEVKFYDECTCSSVSNCNGNSSSSGPLNCNGNGSPIREDEEEILF